MLQQLGLADSPPACHDSEPRRLQGLALNPPQGLQLLFSVVEFHTPTATPITVTTVTEAILSYSHPRCPVGEAASRDSNYGKGCSSPRWHRVATCLRIPVASAVAEVCLTQRRLPGFRQLAVYSPDKPCPIPIKTPESTCPPSPLAQPARRNARIVANARNFNWDPVSVISSFVMMPLCLPQAWLPLCRRCQSYIRALPVDPASHLQTSF